MTPAARVQAAIELLDLIIASSRDNGAAADRIIADWCKTRRYAGSKDRRAVRELVYRAIRSFGEVPVSGRAAILGLGDQDALFDGSDYGPATPLPDEPRELPSQLPEWLAELVPTEEQGALLARAPLDLRVNRTSTTQAHALAELPGSEPIVGLPFGVRLREAIDLEQHPLWREGLVEIQDAGSQLIASACRAAPGMTIIDLCAGAGGKTLALAADMEGQGRLIACDSDRKRLSRLSPRADRAGASGETRLLNPGKEVEMLADLQCTADIVLIDAPCSGTGTLRRNPEARWRISPERIEQVAKTQAHLLRVGTELVKPGGALVYAVCSILDREGMGQIVPFLAENPGWNAVFLDLPLGRSHGPGWRLTPVHDRTDGFFIARLERSC